MKKMFQGESQNKTGIKTFSQLFSIYGVGQICLYLNAIQSVFPFQLLGFTVMI